LAGLARLTEFAVVTLGSSWRVDFCGLFLGATGLYLGLAWLSRCHEIEEVYGIATRRSALGSVRGDRVELGSALFFVSNSNAREVETGLAINTLIPPTTGFGEVLRSLQKRKLELANISRDDLVDFLTGFTGKSWIETGGAESGIAAGLFFPRRAMQDAIVYDPARTGSPKIRKFVAGVSSAILEE